MDKVIIKGAIAGLIAGIIAAIVAALVAQSATEFANQVSNTIGMHSAVAGYAAHLVVAAILGAVYAIFAHLTHLDEFETAVPLILGAILYAVFLYLMTYTLIIGQLLGETTISVAANMSMVFVYSLTLAMILWRPKVSYADIDHGAKPLDAGQEKIQLADKVV